MRAVAAILLVALGCGQAESPGGGGEGADERDQADTGCRIVLRQLDGLGALDVDVDSALVASGGGAGVLLSVDGGAFHELAGAPASIDGGLAGYQRLRFVIDAPGAARVELIPFARTAGGARLFDHNRPHEGDNYVATAADGFAIPLDEQSCPARTERWQAMTELRDDTDNHRDGKPDGGWFVTPVHVNLLADGRVLVTGWERRDRKACFSPDGARQFGVSFLLDPADIAGGTLEIAPIDEHPETDGDVLYCAGHAPLADGRILFTGGSRYPGGTAQPDHGIRSARLYDPGAGAFSLIPQSMIGGPPGGEGQRWYPTNTRLPDGRILVTGGFTRCCDAAAFTNLSIELYDPAAADAGATPWSLLVPHAQGRAEIGGLLRDYPHVFVLPEPVSAAGRAHQVAIVGAQGKVTLFNPIDPLAAPDRFALPVNAARPAPSAEDSTAVLTSTGEILIVGGSPDRDAAQRVDLYDPVGDRWRSLPTGISRYTASSVLLPDGTVLLVNGEGGSDGDRRRPQIVDPRTDQVTTLEPWTDDPDQRGYHSFALLLADGRILIGGGTSNEHGIGCERTDLRLYEPPYLFRGERPAVEASGPLTFGDADLVIEVAGPPPRASGGVVLMALGAATHSFDQNQRYVALDAATEPDGRIRIHAPTATAAPPGDYNLFVIAASGAVSTGVPVRVK